MIAEKIKEINTVSDQITKKSEEQKINEFLDYINDLQKDIKYLTTLYEELERIMYNNQDTNETEILTNIDLLNNLLGLTFTLIENYKESTIYSGIKTELSKLFLIVGTIKEIINDIKYKHETSKTEEHQAINHKLIELL